jgi:hypothetical protein
VRAEQSPCGRDLRIVFAQMDAIGADVLCDADVVVDQHRHAETLADRQQCQCLRTFQRRIGLLVAVLQQHGAATQRGGDLDAQRRGIGTIGCQDIESAAGPAGSGDRHRLSCATR